MKENKISSISKSNSIKEIGEFWDNHDLSDFADSIEDADFEVDIKKEGMYFFLEQNLSEKVMNLSKLYRQPAGILLNKWVEEKLEALIHE